MRKKEEIMAHHEKVTDAAIGNGIRLPTAERLQDALTLEVLIDIRDTLEKIHNHLPN